MVLAFLKHWIGMFICHWGSSFHRNSAVMGLLLVFIDIGSDFDSCSFDNLFCWISISVTVVIAFWFYLFCNLLLFVSVLFISSLNHWLVVDVDCGFIWVSIDWSVFSLILGQPLMIQRGKVAYWLSDLMQGWTMSSKQEVVSLKG